MSGPLMPARDAQPQKDFFAALDRHPINKLFAQLNGGDDEDIEKAVAAMRAIADDAAWLASTPQGQRVVEWLLDSTLRLPMLVYGLPADQKIEYYSRREGANNVAWQLLQAIAQGRNQQLPSRQGQP